MNGAWFFQPPNYNVSEFGNPGMVYPVPSNFDSDFKIRITVTDTDVIPLVPDEDDDDDDDDKDDLMELLIIIIFIIVISAAIISLIVIIIVKARK